MFDEGNTIGNGETAATHVGGIGPHVRMHRPSGQMSLGELRETLTNMNGAPVYSDDTLHRVMAILREERGEAGSVQAAATHADEATTGRTGHVAGNSRHTPKREGAGDEAGVKDDDLSDRG